MSKAKEIADERLAKGEISTEEHKILISRLSTPMESVSGKSIENTPTQTSNSEMPKGSYFWGVAGLVMSILVYYYTANMVDEIVLKCQQRGNTFDFCRQYGVRWPVMYGMYAFSAFMLLYGGVMLFLPKK